MKRTRAKEPEQPYPSHWKVSEKITVHGREVVKGTELSISGATGRFRFMRHVVSGNNEWIDVWGGPPKAPAWRSFRIDRIKTVHRVNRTGENLLAERKAAKR